MLSEYGLESRSGSAPVSLFWEDMVNSERYKNNYQNYEESDGAVPSVGYVSLFLAQQILHLQ